MTTIVVTDRRVLADYIPSTALANVLLVAGAASFVGLLAQVSIPLGFTPVPLTGQTLGVALAGAALGWRRALASMSLYVVAGLAGLPWFAQHSHGFPTYTFGYLFGFVVAGAILGALAERGRDRSVLSAVPAMLAAEIVIFFFGVAWLKYSAHLSVAQAISNGLTPFLGVEAIKIVLAGAALPSAWRLVERVTR